MKKDIDEKYEDKPEKPVRRHPRAVMNEEERQLRKEMHRKCECVIRFYSRLIAETTRKN